MKKQWCLALTALMAQGVQAKVDVYGRVHVSVDYLSTHNTYHGINYSSNASRIGFRAQDGIGEAVVFMQLEQQYNTFQDSKAALATRNTYVGLTHPTWGVVRLGRFDSPFKTARGPANLFADQLGDMRSMMREDGFDKRLDNTLEVQTPSLFGWRFNFAYSLHEDEVNESDENQQSYSVSGVYEQGAWHAALAYENLQKDVGGRDSVRAALAYQWHANSKAVLFYQHNGATKMRPSNQIYGVGGTYKWANGLVAKGMFMERFAATNAENVQLAVLGAEYRLGQPLLLYVNYAYVTNGENTSVAPWNVSGRSNAKAGVQAIAAGENSEGFSMGMRYDF